jgi:hypothetical protein
MSGATIIYFKRQGLRSFLKDGWIREVRERQKRKFTHG